MAKKVALIMGSDSDFPVLKGCVTKLKSFGVEVEVHVMSAHRTPELACSFAAKARDNGFGVIIAAAGKAAHLAGVLAAHTTLPVIGIPVCAIRTFSPQSTQNFTSRSYSLCTSFSMANKEHRYSKLE